MCPQCRFECSTKTLVKLYISFDSNAPSSSNNAPSSSNNDPLSSNCVVQKLENAGEKSVKLQNTLNDTV